MKYHFNPSHIVDGWLLGCDEGLVDNDGSGVLNVSLVGFNVGTVVMLGAEEGSDDGKSLTVGCEDGRLLGDVLIDGDSVN